MNDEQLKEALAQFDEFFESGDTLTFEPVLAEAARLVLDPERAVNWCVVHDSQAAGLYVDGRGWCSGTDDDEREPGWDCQVEEFRMVPARLLIGGDSE